MSERSLSISENPVISLPENISCRESNRKKKSVEFNSNLKVILIPSVIDYKAAALIQNLWWSNSDYRSFEASAFSEIKIFSVNEGINLSTARKILYQPILHSASPNSSVTVFEDAILSSSSYEEDIYYDLSPPISDVKTVEEASLENDDYSNGFIQKKISRRNTISSVSSDGNLSKLASANSTIFASAPSNSNLSRLPSSLDDALLSLCVPLTDIFPISFKERDRRCHGGKRRDKSSGSSLAASWLNDIGMGVASVLALTLVLLPALVSFETLHNS